jgi:adenylate cyclase
VSLRVRRRRRVEAYDLYLRGRLEWETFRPDGLEASIRYFTSALQLDPHYAMAYAGIAKSYSVMAIYGVMNEEEAWNRSRDAAVRALELDPTVAEAHAPLAAAAIFHDRNWNRADEETRRALELDPASDAHTLRAYVLQATGHADAAVAELRRERELDPLWLVAQNDCVVGLYLARRYDEAIAEGLRLLKLQPNDSTPRYFVGKALRFKGRLDEAALQQETVLKNAPDFVLSIAELGAISAQRGDRAAAEMRIAQLQKLRASDRRRRLDYALGTLYAALGDYDRALQSLDDSVRMHYGFAWEVTTDAAFDSLRNDSRYRELLAKLNLIQAHASSSL